MESDEPVHADGPQSAHAGSLAEIDGARHTGRHAHPDVLELRLPLDRRAPNAGRFFVQCYEDRLSSIVLGDAQLIISELIANSVSHSGVAAEEGVIVRIRLTDTTLRLEVEDPGHRGAVAPGAPGAQHGGGFGLNLVQQLSRRWGVERSHEGGTRVWADLARVV